MLLSASLGAVSGCSGDGLDPGKKVDSSELYWALELNHHAVTLATVVTPPYDTLTLVATPQTSDGTPLAGLPIAELPAVTYRSGAPANVGVTTDGVLHGLEPTPSEVPVVATLTIGNLRHADTVWVKVVALEGPPPVLDSFSIHPTPIGGYADSAKVGAIYFGATNGATTCFALPTAVELSYFSTYCPIQLPVRVLDTAGAPIPNVPVEIRSSDREAAIIVNHGFQTGILGQIWFGTRVPPSEVKFYASTTIFGVAKADTLPFRIGWPVLTRVTIQRTGVDYPVLKVGTGAIVIWDNQDSSAVDINFADPTNVAEVGSATSFLPTSIVPLWCQDLALCDDAGNMVLSPSSDGFGALRRFPVPGTYDYSSTALGISGRIIVVDER